MSKRYNPDKNIGLSKEQVNERIKDNLVNFNTNVKTKSAKEIILENTVTLFNIINAILAVAIILVGSYKNLGFLLIIVLNTVISTFQELHSKSVIDKLSVVSASKVKVLRDKEEYDVNLDEVVLDDIIILELGNQVITDAIIVDGVVEVDESFITGESDTLIKKEGDMLLSGSFIVSGNAKAKVEHIGYDNYTAKISSDTKYIKPISSEIMRSLNKIVKTISVIIVPLGILLFARQLYLSGNTLQNAVVNTVAAIIGMIPEGLVLLTSTVFAVSVIRLSKEKVLVHNFCLAENVDYVVKYYENNKVYKAYHQKSGMYKGKFIAKDNYGHGGSKYKLLKEISGKRLELIGDLDIDGLLMTSKHSSNLGKIYDYWGKKFL